MIDEEGGISEVIQADVTDEESCKNAVAKAVALFGSVNILVNIGMNDHITLLQSWRTLKLIQGSCSWRWGCHGRCH